jgi:hypothetical protein
MSRQRNAADATDEARQKYHAALCEAKLAEFAAMGGVVGVTRVRLPETYYAIIGPFVVVGAVVEYAAAQYLLAPLKQDGTASKAISARRSDTVVIRPEDQP